MNLLVQTFGKVPECKEPNPPPPSVLSCLTHNQVAHTSTAVLSEALGLTRIEELTSRKHFNPPSG